MKKSVYLLSAVGLLAICSFYVNPTTPTEKDSHKSDVTVQVKNGQDPDDKITVCHKPDGKNPHEITISINALDAHLAHGDTIGSCNGNNDPGGPL